VADFCGCCPTADQVEDDGHMFEKPLYSLLVHIYHITPYSPHAVFALLLYILRHVWITIDFIVQPRFTLLKQECTLAVGKK
jgi:hypothetical protein